MSGAAGDLTPELLESGVWTDEMVQRAGIPMQDSWIVSVGGGLGSFALAHVLRVAGLPPEGLSVLGNGLDPARTYRYLARNSQIPDGERLRSDAGSTMDSLWGFPSYAWREAFSAESFAEKIAPLWQVLTEPLLTDYYTPKAGQVYASVDKEAARIGWAQMLSLGVVRMVRRRHGGGYFTVLTPASDSGQHGGQHSGQHGGQNSGTGDPDRSRSGGPTRRLIHRSRFVHVAVGYPGVKFLPDLQAYREKHADYSRVVNAYEPHDQVYEELRRRPSTVMVRGSGIVASRILQRLIDDRLQQGSQTTIIHLFRNYVSGPQGDDAKFRRPGGNGVAYQGFNFPKAAWGGQLKERLEKLDGHGRADLIGQMGGTNTPSRADWQEQLEQGRREGFYIQQQGTVQRVEPGADQTISTVVRGSDGVERTLQANMVIDATGLESDLSEHRLLKDLLDFGGAQRNPLGRLDVTPSFEATGTRSDPGRLYASGSITLGGYYAGVDSFLGLQYAALAIADDLASAGAVGRIDMMRSVSEWWRWVRNRQPVSKPIPVAAPTLPPPPVPGVVR